MKTYRSLVLVSSDARSLELGAQQVFQKIQQEVNRLGLDEEVSVSMVGDVGRHDAIPMVIIYP